MVFWKVFGAGESPATSTSPRPRCCSRHRVLPASRSQWRPHSPSTRHRRRRRPQPSNRISDSPSTTILSERRLLSWHAGIAIVPGSAAFATCQDYMEGLLSEQGNEKASGVAVRAAIAKVVVARQNAKTRSSTMAQAEADSEVKQVPKALWRPEFQLMRAALEQKWWRLEDKFSPHRSCLERILEESEKEDVKPERLTVVLHSGQGDGAVVNLVCVLSGTLKASTAFRCQLPWES